MERAKSMTSGDGLQTTTSLRVAGGIVIASALLLTVLLSFFIRSPLGFHSQKLEGLFVRSLLVCMVVVPVGGFYMLIRTGSRWWLLTLLPLTGVIVMWILISLMVPAAFH